MPDHCIHEGDIATLQTESKEFRDDVVGMRGDIKEILKCLKGNGSNGLVTRVALVEQRVGRSSDNRKWLTRTIGGAAIVSILYVFQDAMMWIVKMLGG